MGADVTDLMQSQYADLVETANRLRKSCIREDGTPIVLIKQGDETIRNPYLDEYHWTCEQIRNLERKISVETPTAPDSKPGVRTVDTATLADVFGITKRRVQQLYGSKIIPGEKRGRAFYFDLAEAARAYIAYLNGQRSEKDDETLEESRLKADIDYKRAKAAQAELELDELRGNLHRSEDVEDAFNGLIYAVRAGLTAAPPRIATDLQRCKNKTEQTKVIREEMNRLLNDFEGYRYTPGFFEDKVRERKGWGERP